MVMTCGHFATIPGNSGEIQAAASPSAPKCILAPAPNSRGMPLIVTARPIIIICPTYTVQSMPCMDSSTCPQSREDAHDLTEGGILVPTVCSALFEYGGRSTYHLSSMFPVEFINHLLRGLDDAETTRRV